jgi:hypothetical protein
MNTQFDLKEIEHKAFRSTFQDGLLDMQYGLMIVGMSIFIYRPASGYSVINILLMLGTFVLANLLFWLGKKFITLPRMGQVQFGEIRKKRNRTLIIVMSCFVLLQVVLLGFTVFAWLDPQVALNVNTFLKDRNIMDLAVALIGALIVSTGMLLVAYFTDFPRGYYIAIMMSLAVFLMLYINQPLYPILIGALILIPGIVLFVRFLKRYPLHREGEDSHG